MMKFKTTGNNKYVEIKWNDNLPSLDNNYQFK